jgi:plastocyanin
MRIAFPPTPLGHAVQTPARLALLGALALLPAGCGSHLVKVDSTVVRLRVDEYSITPQLVQVHPGRLKVVVVNTGILTHNVRVESQHPNSAGNPAVLGGTGVAQPGQKVTSPKLTLAPGTYRLVDTIANHADLGDYGTLIVK